MTALTFSSGDDQAWAMAMDATGAFLVVGSFAGTPGHIMSVLLSNFTLIGSTASFNTGEQGIVSLLLDGTRAFGIACLNTEPAQLIKFSTADCVIVGKLQGWKLRVGSYKVAAVIASTFNTFE